MTTLRPRAELVLAALLFALVALGSHLTQAPLTFNRGLGWDGALYFRVAESLAAGHRPAVEAPFVYRLGVPLLAAILSPGDLVRGFLLANVAGGLAATLLLAAWLRLHLRRPLERLALVALFVTQWHGPVRFPHFYPVLVDTWFFVFLLAGLIAVEIAREKPGSGRALALLGLISFAGILFREGVLLVPLAFPLVRAPLRRGRITLPEPRLLVPLACGLVGLALTRVLGHPVAGYSFLSAAAKWLVEKPAHLYFLGWLIAFGPVLVLPLYAWRRSFAWLAERQDLALMLAAIALLGWVGGSDTERILYWSSPIVYVLVGRAVEELHPDRLFLLVLAGSQAVSQRVFWTLPDYPSAAPTPLPVLTIPSSAFQYLDVYSQYATRRVQLLSLAEYLVLGAALLFWLHRRPRRRGET